jgi:hypothetical protein
MPNAREERWERTAQMRSSVVGNVFMFDNYESGDVLAEGRAVYGTAAGAASFPFYQREI